jgi:hypothetical protein
MFMIYYCIYDFALPRHGFWPLAMGTGNFCAPVHADSDVKANASQVPVHSNEHRLRNLYDYR